jgi:hypothetical protein
VASPQWTQYLHPLAVGSPHEHTSVANAQLAVARFVPHAEQAVASALSSEPQWEQKAIAARLPVTVDLEEGPARVDAPV